MNTTIFSERLRECRKRKYSSQQAFADAYLNTFGLIRQSKNNDNNMFGTIQSWEQGKSEPTATVLANICQLLDCDADYLLGRIDERTHDINDAHQYTGLSSAALEQLHAYRESLLKEKNWEDEALSYLSHEYYQAFALFFIDEILTGSKNTKLNGSLLYQIFSTSYEKIDAPEIWDQDEVMESIDLNLYVLVNNIRDIIRENAAGRIFPPALEIPINDDIYSFELKK